VRKNVSGERDNEVLPATPFLAVTGGVSNQLGLQGIVTVSCGPSLSNFMPIILNKGLWVSAFPNKYRRCHTRIARYQPALAYG
jgi:hypothetical protein